MDTLTAATIAAQPEVGIPLYAATHPKKSLGAVLLAWTIVLLLVGIVLSFLKFTRGLGHFVLVAGLLCGAGSAYMIFSKPKQSAR